MEFRVLHIAVALALVLSISSVYGAVIIAPTQSMEFTAFPTPITLSWTGQAPFRVLLSGSASLNITTNQTSYNVSLPQGSYTLHVSDNVSDTKSFSLTQTQPLLITLSIPQTTYEIDELVEFTVTTNKEVSATLSIRKDNVQIEQYTVPLSGTTNLFYIPEEGGVYSATVTALGVSSVATWSVTDTVPLTSSFTHTATYADTVATFTSSTSGGVPPYTYTWLFSDDTTSTGKIATHYFFEAGAHNATLVVTDSENTQSTSTQSFTIQEKLYDVQITLKDQHGVLLEDYEVEFVDNSTEEDYEEDTNTLGTALFKLRKANYTLYVRDIKELFKEAIVITGKLNKLYTITINSSSQPPTQNNQTTQTTAQNNTTTSKTTTQNPVSAQESVPTEEQPVEELSIEDTFELEIEETIAEIDSQKFTFQVSTQEDKVLRHLQLYPRFSEAKVLAQQAQSPDDLAEALAIIPQKITIVDSSTKVYYPNDEELNFALLEFLESKGVRDEGLLRQYEQNMRRVLKNTSVKTETLVVDVRVDGATQTHTIVSREITSPTDTYVVEVIPKSFASSANQMRIDGLHEVIEEDPIIRFNTKQYQYSAKTLSKELGEVLVLPYELEESSMISGLVSFALGDSNPVRSIIYVVILGMVTVALFAGVGSRKSGSRDFDDFANLTSQAIDFIHSGQEERAANITSDIIAIYGMLPEKQQLELRDIIRQLEDVKQVYDFKEHLSSAYETVNQAAGDVNIITSTYEDVLSQYEMLTPHVQKSLEQHITELNSYLDKLHVA